MPSVRYLPAIKSCINRHVQNIFDHSDFMKWRYCYEGGTDFITEYLERYVGSTGQEGQAAFNRREKLTPVPSFAKKEINAVKNSISRRLGDVDRPGGSDKFQDAIAGNGRGVDLRGSTMNAYLTKKILPELLPMGKVGVLVDAPDVQATSRAQVPKDFQPYLNRFVRENTLIAIEADADSPSDWAHVLLESQKHDFNLLTGKQDCVRSFRYYYLDEDRGNLVTLVFLNEQGDPIGGKETNLDSVPFVQFDIGGSLMADACSHQITLLNMISADSNYAIDSNFPFLVRQRGATEIGEHLEGGEGGDTTRAGTNYGLYYGKGMNAPGFISPPPEGMLASLELRKELKNEIHELVTGSLADLGEEGSVEAGLNAIGLCLQASESRIWDHWAAYEDTRPESRKVATINYPDSWSLKTDEQRLVEAEKFIKLGNIMVGETNKKALAKKAVGIMHRGTVSTSELKKMEAEIDASPIGLADPAVIISAKKEQILCTETAAAALGAKDPKKEAEVCATEAADRAAQIVAAQSDIAAAGAGNDDGQVDPKSKDNEKEGGDANFTKPGDAGRPSNEENE